MKYNVLINQQALADTDLDFQDAAILDYIYIYCNSLHPNIVKLRKSDKAGAWTWLNIDSVLRNLPLLRISSKGAITPRLRKIERAGFIVTKRVEHQRLYVRLLPKMDELFIEMNRAIHENEQSYSKKRTNNTISDYSIIDNKSIHGNGKTAMPCPLNGTSPLKAKYPNGHHECEEYIEEEEADRGRKFINRPKQYANLHKILRAGYGFDVMSRTIKEVERKYGQGGWDYATLAAWIEKGGGQDGH